MENLVISDFKLGIIAGGQLGKMLVLAAANWDVKTLVLDREDHCPASDVCTRFVKGDPHSFEDVYNFGKQVDMLTFEIESVNIEAVKKLKAEGIRIHPDPGALEIIQDKGMQKHFYQKNRIPTARFQIFESEDSIKEAIGDGTISFPFVQKLRTGGYDGRGVAVIKSPADMHLLLKGASVIEEKIQIAKEISVIAARNQRGEVRCFPVVEMVFNEEANLVEKLICPSSIDSEKQQEAITLATQVIEAFELQGLLAVEMFLDKEEKIWVNESAPRTHNSGHHTIESVITSQFEQQLRAIFNFSLGSTHLKLPAVMINLLGEPGYEGDVKYEGLTECMAIEGVKFHLYGKKISKPYRKMGHATILGTTIERAIERADIVKNQLKITAWQKQS
ncbi:MAG: 5-(carboxyamino)imidazole ribonucleotide synthase [Bacteroidales bacterium]|nr:5-(carboxyamino)imidazole ribonucleotide synthase [Bacteroidales bacterium]